jgi:hypothetical protein
MPLYKVLRNFPNEFVQIGNEMELHQKIFPVLPSTVNSSNNETVRLYLRKFKVFLYAY